MACENVVPAAGKSLPANEGFPSPCRVPQTQAAWQASWWRTVSSQQTGPGHPRSPLPGPRILDEESWELTGNKSCAPHPTDSPQCSSGSPGGWSKPKAQAAPTLANQTPRCAPQSQFVRGTQTAPRKPKGRPMGCSLC